MCIVLCGYQPKTKMIKSIGRYFVVLGILYIVSLNNHPIGFILLVLII